MSDKAKKQESPFANLLFNIILPVIILNNLSKHLGNNGPTVALIIALLFPLGYGAYDYIKTKNKNFLSIFGIINVLFTGGFALFQLEGFWFAVKEAAFPFLIGIAVMISAYTKSPLLQLMMLNESVLNINLIKSKLAENNKEAEFKNLLKTSTVWFSISFFLSSLLNFLLATYIFKDINPGLSDLERTAKLNEQIADMTWLSFIVIAFPLMIFMGGVLWHFFKRLKELTSLELQDVIVSQK